MELGAHATQDDCILNHNDVLISLDEKALILYVSYSYEYNNETENYEGVYNFPYQAC